MNTASSPSPCGAGISSMTGFGRSEQSAAGQRVSIEIRSVNNRFCDISLRLPRELNNLEAEIRERVRGRVARGRVNIAIVFECETMKELALRMDLPAASQCFQKLAELQKTLALEAPVTLSDLLHFSDLFTKEPEPCVDEERVLLLTSALDAALDDFAQMRRSEGVNLALDLIARLDHIEATLQEIEGLSHEQPQVQMQKLRERLGLLVATGPVDPGRLELEMAIIADRLDVTEECVRLRSHCQHFRAAMAGVEPPGKRLSFLLQEMHREVNTISSKSALAEITHRTIILKEEIERMREQAQNLE